MEKYGTVYLIGAGPGDPKLLTCGAAEVIKTADVVIYDYLVGESILSMIPSSVEKIYVGKKSGDHTLPQDQINELLAIHAKRVKSVVRLKGGDPYIFGRGSEEALYLQERNISVIVYPGIPAAIGAAAYTGIPLTDRQYSSLVTFVTGHEDPTKKESSVPWDHLAKLKGTLVIYMGIGNVEQIVDKLKVNGLSESTPVSCVFRATTPYQKVVKSTLKEIVADLQKQNMKPPALIIIGDVNNYYPSLSWFEKQPLFGKKFIVTRSRSQSSMLVKTLLDLGANVTEIPTIDIQPCESYSQLDSAIQMIHEYTWVVFTSTNGVEYFFKRLFSLQKDARALASCKIASIGDATSKSLKNFGIQPDLQSPQFTTVQLFETLKEKNDLSKERFLLARASIGDVIFREKLQTAGAYVDDIPVYNTIPVNHNTNEILQLILEQHIDGITFTSSSTVKNFIELFTADEYEKIKQHIKAFSIGPQTSTTLRSYGIQPVTEAKVFTIDGLVESIKNYFEGKQSW